MRIYNMHIQTYGVKAVSRHVVSGFTDRYINQDMGYFSTGGRL